MMSRSLIPLFALTLIACGGPKTTPDEVPVQTHVDASTLPEEAPKSIVSYKYGSACSDTMTRIKGALEGMGHTVAAEEGTSLTTGTISSETAPLEYTYKLALTDKSGQCAVVATKLFKGPQGSARSQRDTNFEWSLLKSIDANAASTLVK